MSPDHDKVIPPRQSQEDLLTAWLTLSGSKGAGNKPVRLPVLSGSMLPMMPLGSTLVIAPCASSNVQRGDVVVFQEGNRLVAHRLLLQFHIGSLQILYQKGDNNAHGGWISPALIKGKVLKVERENETIPVFSNHAASESLLHLFRSYLRSLIIKRR